MAFPETSWLKYVTLSGESYLLVRSQALMLPLRKTIWLRDVKLLLVATVGIVRVAARDERIAIRMDLVCGVADLDGGTGYPPLAKRGAKGRLNFPVIGLLNASKVRGLNQSNSVTQR